MPPVKKPKVTLDDLSPEDRARLAAEIAAGAEIDRTEQEQRAAAIARGFADHMDPRDHLRNCPAEEGAGRFEWYGDTKPANPAQAIPAKPVTVVRCIECGGTTVIERQISDVRSELEAGLEAT